MNVAYSSSAAADLQQIWEHYAEHTSRLVGRDVVRRIKATLERTIGKHKRVGRLRPEFGSDIRSFPVVPYVAFYRIASNRVRIVRILHGHRDIRPPLMSLMVAA